jgi:hypothetical protein
MLHPRDFGDGLDDVGVGAAAADVAAHALAQLVGRQQRPRGEVGADVAGDAAAISSSTPTAEQIWPGVQ